MTATTPKAPAHRPREAPAGQPPRPGARRQRESSRPARSASATRPRTTQAGPSPPGLSIVPEAGPLIDDRLLRAFPPLRLGLQMLELTLERVSSVVWRRPWKRRATTPSYDSSVLTNVLPSRGSSVWT